LAWAGGPVTVFRLVTTADDASYAIGRACENSRTQVCPPKVRG
jgi:hypothetical protein